MRSYIVFGALLLMVCGLVALLVMRPRPSHRMPPVPVTAETQAPTAGDAGASDRAEEAGADLAPPSRAGSDAGPAADGAAPRALDRPLRVVGLGWELLAPGLVANRGTMPGEGSLFTAEGLEAHISVAHRTVDVERALARGGADPAGADVAIVPLPALIASGERLRALEPRVFLVTGWSRGREALLASGEGGLARLPATGEVLVAGEEGTTAAFLALFVLDLAGVPSSRVRFVPPGEPNAATAPLAAVERGVAGGANEEGRTVVLTTADAARLIPYVAVAPRGFVEGHGAALEALARGWLRGVGDLGRDVPTAARRIAVLEGAPEALVLLERLGQIDAVGAADNARMVGLTGRSAATVEALFRHGWRVLREADVLTSPAPEQSPVSTATIELLVRGEPSLAPDASTTPPLRPATGPIGPAREQAAVLAWSAPAGPYDEEAVVSTVGFLAGVFEPLPVRVTLRADRGQGPELLSTARERFGLAEGRLVEGRTVVGSGPASIEVLSAP